MADKIIILREGVISSWLKDGFTIVMLAVLPWFNHAYAGGSGWIYAAISFGWFIAIISRASGMKAKATKTPAEARAWLEANHPADKEGAR